MISTRQKTIAPSVIAITAITVLFAAAPLVATPAQAGGWGWGHHGWGWGHHGWGWGWGHHGWGWGHHGWHR